MQGSIRLNWRLGELFRVYEMTKCPEADVPQRSEAYLLGVACSSIMANAKSARAKNGLASTMDFDY